MTHFTVVDNCKALVFMTIGGAMLAVPGDDIGTLHNTLVEVVLPGLADVSPPKEPGGIPSGHESAINVLNGIIEHYRVLVPAPQIRPVPYKHARSFEFEIHPADGAGTEGFFQAAGLSPKGEAAKVPPAKPEKVAEIQASAKTGPVPLWVTLKMDAYADFAAGNPLSGMAHLYMSFEMFAHGACRRLGRGMPGAQVVEEFLNPQKASHPPFIR
jgi:hypothetical protein